RPPDGHPVPERPSHPVREAGEPVDDAGILPPALALDPERVGEVVEGHRRHHAVVADRIAHRPVVIELPLVEAPLLGLEPAPLDGDALRRVPERGREAKVPVEALVVVAGEPGDGAVPDVAALLLPRPPLVVAAAAFDLVRGGGRTPEEASREGEAARHGSALLSSPAAPVP